MISSVSSSSTLEAAKSALKESQSPAERTEVGLDNDGDRVADSHQAAASNPTGRSTWTA